MNPDRLAEVNSVVDHIKELNPRQINEILKQANNILIDKMKERDASIEADKRLALEAAESKRMRETLYLDPNNTSDANPLYVSTIGNPSKFTRQQALEYINAALPKDPYGNVKESDGILNQTLNPVYREYYNKNRGVGARLMFDGPGLDQKKLPKDGKALTYKYYGGKRRRRTRR